MVRVLLNLRSRFIHCPLLNGERLTGLALICAARRRESQAFVNGAMHWVACRVYEDGF